MRKLKTLTTPGSSRTELQTVLSEWWGEEDTTHLLNQLFYLFLCHFPCSRLRVKHGLAIAEAKGFVGQLAWWIFFIILAEERFLFLLYFAFSFLCSYFHSQQHRDWRLH
jgi:hypothetical protein